MKLDRNTNDNGRGKYALIKLREVNTAAHNKANDALNDLIATGVVDFGSDPETEFFVIRLKDRSAYSALKAYAAAARTYDLEWAKEIDALAEKSLTHPHRRMPT